MTLTTEAPSATRSLVVRATTSKPPDMFASAELKARVSATWTPADPSLTASPSLRAVLFDREPQFYGEPAILPLVAGQPVTMEVPLILARDCKLGASCEWTADLLLELRDGADGKVEVTWTASAEAFMTDSDLPKDFTVTLSEP
ncbi:hypothetical protein [Corallococcus sp. RDP092CA]|uniref:hypothetical protein n=1 Tax=Corallococcus sp. RDP092CA TaxID=3109369 RepID=UPI0035B08CE8